MKKLSLKFGRVALCTASGAASLVHWQVADVVLVI